MDKRFSQRLFKHRILFSVLLIAVLLLSTSGIWLPAGFTASAAGTAPSVEGDGVHYLGCQRSDTTGFDKISVPGAGMPLAASVDLSSKIPPIGNQGDQGSCAAWSTGYCYKSWAEKKKHPGRDLTDPQYQFSPSFIYNQVNGGVDQGTSLSKVFALLEKKGDVSIEEMPYDPDDYTTQPTATQFEAAKQYRIPGDWGYFWCNEDEGPYRTPNNIADVKAWLASGRALVMAIPMYLDFPGYNGRPPSPYYVYNGTSPFDGGHGVAIVGYDDNINPGGSDADHRGGFLMANSWGTTWNGASKGFIYLSYDFVKRYVLEAWSMNDDLVAGSTWYLAEGTTAWDFLCNICVMNPNNTDVRARVTYMTGEGEVDGGTYTCPARSAGYADPSDVLGEKDFSTKVECLDNKPIAVDRNMYFKPSWSSGDVFEGHASVGVNAPARQWYLPEGSSAWGFECWLLIQNPWGSQAYCDITYMIEGEGPRTVTEPVPAGSRRSFNISQHIGYRDASIFVDSNVPVIPERAMYRDERREGHDSIGTTLPAKDFYLAEGTTAWGFTTYVLVQNPNSSPNTVDITYMTPNGPVKQSTFTMPENSRTTIRVNDVPGVSSIDLSTHVHGSKPFIAERSMYWVGGEVTKEAEVCHDSIGMAEPHKNFYLPTGQTGGEHGAETFTLVQNLNTVPVKVKITYVTLNGEGNTEFVETIPAQSRKTFNMADRVPEGSRGIIVECLTSGKKIMVERAMYHINRGCGTDTIGGYSD